MNSYMQMSENQGSGSLDNNDDGDRFALPKRAADSSPETLERKTRPARPPNARRGNLLHLQPSGDPSAVAPPVPIPNTEVKRCSPDDSVSIGYAKVGRRQSYAPFLAKSRERGACFVRRQTGDGDQPINNWGSTAGGRAGRVWIEVTGTAVSSLVRRFALGIRRIFVISRGRLGVGVKAQE